MAGKKAGNLNKTTVAELADDKAAVYKIKNAKGDNVFTGAVARGKVQEQIAERSLTNVYVMAEARKSAERIIKRDQPKYNK